MVGCFESVIKFLHRGGGQGNAAAQRRRGVSGQRQLLGVGGGGG